MRVGAIWAILGACVVAAACGSDKPSSGSGPGSGGDGDTTGAGSGNRAGTSAGGTSASQAGSQNGLAGAEAPQGGANDPGASGAAGAAGTTEVPGPKTIHFDVVGSKQVHPISPLIYGANMDGLSCGDSKARFSFCRHRSAAWSTYNWENNASNAGASDCNENNDALSSSKSPGAAVTTLIDQADAAKASTIVTVPMLEHVALDETGGSAAPDCSGDVGKTSDYLNSRFVQNRPRKGAPLSLTPDTGDAYVNQDEFIAFLKSSHPDSKLLFSLDNQPELWDSEHPRLRSTKLSYDEHVALSVDYAKMLKDAWPSAEVLGLVGYGYLAALNLQTSPDYAQSGEFYSYFLKHLALASQDAGKRLLDYVDLHWFPEIYVDGHRLIEETADDASSRARVQAPRTLWDPTFVEDSWITAANGGKPIELLSWLQGAIVDNYPGTKLSLSEWSYGGGKHISGAIAAADALGIYGQKGVDLAGVVSFSPDDEPYLIGAFEAYRNYDGLGHGFGDTSVLATSSDVAQASIYASVDANDSSRMVIVAINRYAYDLDATLSIDHDTAYASLTPYTISDGQPDPKSGTDIAATSPNQFQMTLPPYSVWVLVPNE